MSEPAICRCLQLLAAGLAIIGDLGSRLVDYRARLAHVGGRRQQVSRAEAAEDFYVGTRRDLLRRVEGGWKISRRRMVLDQAVMTAKNLSIFF